jgi:serine/threonine protein phosphatase PrpC
VREVNEDAFLERPEVGLWLVADGMGGHHAGDVASRMIVDGLKAVGSHRRLSAFVDDVEGCLLAVNGELVALAGGEQSGAMVGSTVVALLASGGHSLCLWAGDSRAYRLRQGRLQLLTQDHSQVEELIERGLILRVDADRHPEANVITRAVGAGATLCLDLDLHRLQAQDRYLLCSDGLYKEVSEAEIERVLGEGDCAEVCRRLIEMARERGARDNVTVVVVHFEAEGPAPAEAGKAP